MVEGENREFVAALHQTSNELLDRLSRVLYALPEHAVAHVEQDAEAYRHALVGELRDLLQFAVFEDVEGLARESGHERAIPVQYRRCNRSQIDGGLEDGQRRCHL